MKHAIKFVSIAIILVAIGSLAYVVLVEETRNHFYPTSPDTLQVAP